MNAHHHQTGVFVRGMSASRWVIQDIERRRSTSGGLGMRSTKGTILAVVSSTGAIHGGAKEIPTASDDLSRRTEQQAASLEETAAALDEITATVRKSA